MHTAVRAKGLGFHKGAFITALHRILRKCFAFGTKIFLCPDGIGVGFLCTGSIPPGGGQGVVAYGGMMVAVDEGQITNIAVHPGCRRKGYGQAVLTALIRYAKSAHLASVTLEVRPSNQAALALYRHSGFSEVGRRKNFYTKPTEDALILTLRLK